MCSETTRRRRSVALAGFATVTLFLVAGCGKKGDPHPAPRTIPQTIADLAVRQRGFEVVLEMTHPKTTVAGLALPGLDEAVVYELQQPAPAAATPATPDTAGQAGAPAAPAAPVVPAAAPLPDKKTFEAMAKPLLRIGGGELASAISGDRITIRFRLPEPLPSPAPQRIYGVRTHAAGGETSDLSNLASLLPRDVPDAPANFVVEPRKSGVALAWQAGPAALAGYNVYRRAADQTGYGLPIAQLDTATAAAVDSAAVYGQRYIYAVTAVASRAPLVESALSTEREVAYDDRFAPVPPAGLTALPQPGEVRLVWDAAIEADVAGYVIERSEPENAFHRLTADPLPVGGELEYVDRGLASGFTFRYRIAAIDRSGNLGDFSPPVSARVP